MPGAKLGAAVGKVASREVGQWLVDFLGDGAPVIPNKAGDIVFLSASELRRVWFDINNPGKDLPHMHIESRQSSTSNWRDQFKGDYRIYPKH